MVQSLGKRSIELLAPARNLACGLAAIDHGADAVYIGGPHFSARAAAANDLPDIEKLVKAAHRFRVKVYVALNTILDDHELELAVKLAWHLHETGVDALIVQDMGLLECPMPPLPLHASTQTDNRTVEKVKFLENVGFGQIVLARELNLSQIREIRASTSATLEFFVHGALCAALSGQCYISEVIAGRSANRGECAQFCRHLFTLRDGSGKVLRRDRHLLSLKDLDLSGHLGDLLLAGIDSFKIEGRLKDELYVKNVTAYYRQALDKLLEGDPGLQRSSSGRCSFPFIPDTARSFNRGRTEFFLLKERNTPGALDSPKSLGQKLGEVNHAGEGFFTIATSEKINNGDGLCFQGSDGRLTGIRVNRVVGARIHPRGHKMPPVGALVYRNRDALFNKQLARSEGCRTIGVRLRLTELDEGLLSMVVSDEDRIVSCTTIKTEKATAKTIGSAAAVAERQLRKSGATIFLVEAVEIDLKPESYYPAAVFNELRRQGFDNHLAKRLGSYVAERSERVVNEYPWPAEEVTYLDNIANHKALQFYRRHGVAKVSELGLKAGGVIHCALMTSRYCLKAQLAICPKEGGNTAGMDEPLILSDKTGEYQLGFDCRRCEMTVRRRQG